MSDRLQKKIIQQLRDKSGTSIVEFAKRQKVSRGCIYSAIKGDGVRRIRVAIAKTLEMPPSMIWTNNHPHKRILDDLYYMELNRDRL